METDYYEVLGIRPSAGADEIELAYRGRRSQYHPDRYATSDAATLEWATSKMKEVNEAYAALRDPLLRGQFDRQRQHQSSGQAGWRSTDHGQAPQQQRSPASLREALQGLVLSREPFERIFIAPHIPPRKLAGALESYGEDLRPQDVVVLIDDTVLGGAREGVLITETEIRAKAVFQSADIRLLSVLSEIAADGKRVLINGYRYTELNVPNKRDLKALFRVVNQYMQHHS